MAIYWVGNLLQICFEDHTSQLLDKHLDKSNIMVVLQLREKLSLEEDTG